MSAEGSRCNGSGCAAAAVERPKWSASAPTTPVLAELKNVRRVQSWASPAVVGSRTVGDPLDPGGMSDGSAFAETRSFVGDNRTSGSCWQIPRGIRGLGLAIADKDNRLLDGGATYQLTVPASVPVTQYWSATVYDRATHAPIRNARWPSRSSQTPGLEKNADGSVTVYFGPNPPAGRESNWVPTSTDGGFEVLFRFYGPQKPLFEKTWRLPDIEKV
jgi:hypothetical protein